MIGSRAAWFTTGVAIVALAVAPAAAQQPNRLAGETAKVMTKDGVELSLTYYPNRGAKDPAIGKKVTPVVLLHDEKDTQGMFSSLVGRLLQEGGKDPNAPGFAVITVDLRGHGTSTRQTAPNGVSRQLDAAKLTRNDILAMSVQDMEAIRRFLVSKNDDGEMNLNKLCLVGAGLGATVAVNWAAEDWAAPPLLVGKQGQDVKALALVSPRWKFKGAMIQQALRFDALKKNVAWMLIYGEQDGQARADAKRIYKQLDHFHPEPESAQSPPRSLAEIPYPSALEGSALMSQVGAPIENNIVSFLTIQSASQDLPWMKRRNRLQN